MRKLAAIFASVVAVGSGLACNPSATAPSDLIPPGTHQSILAAVSGSGRGGVSVTPSAVPERTMMVGINVLVVDARPNTTYIVQRAADVIRVVGADGICQRAMSLPPWSMNDPPAETFVTFPLGAGAANRNLMVADLNVPDADGGGSSGLRLRGDSPRVVGFLARLLNRHFEWRMRHPERREVHPVFWSR